MEKLWDRPPFPANPKSKPIGIYCCNRAIRQIALMALDDIVDILSLAASRNSDQTQDTGMRVFEHDGQFPEVLVLRHEDALLLVSDAQDLLISRIGIPGTSPDDVMPTLIQSRCRAAPNTGIKQKPQAAGASDTGSTRSC